MAKRGWQLTAVTQLIVGLVFSVLAPVVSSWICEKLKRRPPRLRINRITEVEVARDKIKIRIVEQIEKDGQ
jgi:hypothetical protein